MLFTADHDEPRRSLQKFIAAEINPFVDEWEKADMFPAHELFKKLGDLGFLGLNKPVEFGGQGLDYSYALMMAEELGAITCGGVPMAIGVQTDMATPALARFGSDEVRREFLTPAIAGDAVACIGVSEPGAGSDVASIKTNARSDGDDYVINGGKMWITNGVQADWICLLANTSDDQVHRNKSLICVPMKSKGVQVARKLDKMVIVVARELIPLMQAQGREWRRRRQCSALRAGGPSVSRCPTSNGRCCMASCFATPGRWANSAPCRWSPGTSVAATRCRCISKCCTTIPVRLAAFAVASLLALLALVTLRLKSLSNCHV